MSARILLVDDHEVVLEGIRTLVERSGRQWEICGMAHNGKEAVEMAKSLKPDIIVLDISMPVMNGMDAAKIITGSDGNSRILLFTMHESERMEDDAREVGAHGYVVKSQAGRDLIRAIDSVLAGKTFFGAPPERGPVEKRREKKSHESGSAFRSSLAFACA